MTLTVQDLVIGKYCVVRDHMAGVFAGTVTAVDMAAGTWEMTAGDARKIHYWTKAAAVAGIAAHGPGPGSRLCPPQMPAGGRALVEAPLLVSAATETLIREYPEWKP